MVIMPKHVRTLTLDNYIAEPLEKFLRSLVPTAADRAVMREMAIARIMAEPPVPIHTPAQVRGVRSDGRQRTRLSDGREHPITIKRGNATITVSPRTFAKVRERRDTPSMAGQIHAQAQARMIAKLASLGSQADVD